MPIDHRERAFEAAIEHHLLAHGYTTADSAVFDRTRCLDAGAVLAFIRATQGKLWQDLEKLIGTKADDVVLDALVKTLDGQGCLDVLRHGFKCYGKTVRVAFFAPVHGMNPDTKALYDANRLTVTRQLKYSLTNENSVDVVLGLNGLPIVTAELKNPLTGQRCAHAQQQYRNDRDAREALFAFGRRALVHFAVDPDEVSMTTRLAGKATRFLPFNRGNGTGAGNPDKGDGYKTAYLWERVWERHSLLDLVQRFLHLEVTEKTVGERVVRSEALVFPRYHQLDVVRALEAEAKAYGPGNNYLIQHSAGSGKSNSIAWLAHRLASLHDEKDAKVFDSVVVITDRRVLDQQLQNTIYQFEHKSGWVVKIDEDSSQLAESLKAGTPIIITTLQKFPFVTEKVGTLPGRRYAVIIDEAHSSQSGETATELKGVLAADAIQREARAKAEADGLPDHEEEILRTMAKRGRQPNLSFFAFTATPKYKTLEVFGRLGSDGKPAPFHVYSMRQAIEEGFILDVLEHYTTYKTFYRLVKAVADDPQVDKRKAASALGRFMSLHPHNVAQKVEVMIEHFRAVVRHRINGKAKAMVVTGSRLHAVRYKQAFDRYIAEKGYADLRTLVAFSGTVEDPDATGVSYTEPGMNIGTDGNPIGVKQLPDRFASGDYQVLIVAEKYQTGFDQPLLHTMYVDKRLDGVQAVQTLSRLNRTSTGKEDTFVLDFVNDAEVIREAFKPYYERPLVGDQVDPQQLYQLQSKIDAEQIYHSDEIERFSMVFFKPKVTQTPADHAAMNAAIDPAVGRFRALAEDKREEFRGLLGAFRNLYAFMAQIIPFQDADLEKRYTFIRFLLAKLPRRESGPNYDFTDDVNLKYYRLQKISDGTIAMEAGEEGYVTAPTAVGTSAQEAATVELSRLIDLINDRFGTQFTPRDELFFEQLRQDAAADASLVQAAQVNTLDNFAFAFDKALEGLVIDRMEQNQGMFTRFMNEPAFRALVEQTLRKQVYERIRQETLDGKDAAAG